MEALTQTLQQVLGSTILISLMAAIQLPVILTKLSYLLDNPWSVSLDRAAAAGLILADTLVHRNLGVRPVTLVGYSLGARVIFFCLRELARVGASGLVQNAYMFGSPVVVKDDEYAQMVSMVSGRVVNGYANNDWILGYLFRATSGGIGRIAGLAPVNIPGVENIDVTELVNGHMAYRAAMPKLLIKVGWEVTSDEFSEIEDPVSELRTAKVIWMLMNFRIPRITKTASVNSSTNSTRRERNLRQARKSANGISLDASKIRPRKKTGKPTTLTKMPPVPNLPPQPLLMPSPVGATLACSSTSTPFARKSKPAARNHKLRRLRARCRNFGSRLMVQD